MRTAQTRNAPKPRLRDTPSPGKKSDQVQSLVRAITLLNRLAEAPDDGASLTDLAQQVGLASSTAHRLLTTLEQERYVKFNAEGRLWTVGMQAFVTGCAFTRTRSLSSLARPHLRALMEQCGETVSLAIEDEGEAVYLSQVECRQLMRVFSRPGMRVPLHCSGVGKAMLAAMPEKTVAGILHKRGMPRLTVKTLTSAARLREELENIRSVGYAIDDEEHAVGLRCVASALFDESGSAIGAISASGPLARIGEERLASLSTMVLETARRISTEMGASIRQPNEQRST